MNHCDEKALLAYSFGDLPESERSRVEEHVASCRRCHERYSEIQAELRQVQNALDKESALHPEQIERARREFFVRYAALEEEIETRKPTLLPMPSRTWDTAFAARVVLSIAALCLLGIFAWKALRPHQPEPVEVLTQTMDREVGLRGPQTSVHQDFEIEIQQIKPEYETRTGRLRVWFDSNGDRFAGRWEREDGELQYAVWRPDPGREFVYNAQLGTTAVAREPQTGQTITLGEMDFDEATLEQLEAGFLHWLGNRRWEPISIASDVNLFRRRDGVEISVKRIEPVDSQPAYRITASRDTISGRVELVAEVDADTYKPKIELVRLVTEERVVELRLRARHTQWLTSAMMEKGVFWPSVRIEGEPGPLAILHSSSAPRVREEILPAATSLQPASDVELEMAEIRVRYALHQADACLGVPIRIERTADGRLSVEALVDSAARKRELLVRLADISAAPFVSVDIKTVEEALENASAQNADNPNNPANAGALMPTDLARKSGERLEVVATDSPIKPALENYLRHTMAGTDQGPNDHSDAASTDPDQMVSRFSERIVSLSLSNLSEAWALRRLAERYGNENREPLPAAARELLREMVLDHLQGLNERTSDIESDVKPLLLTLATRDRSDRPAGEIEAGGSSAKDWAAQCLRIFQDVESTEAVTTGLFADSGYANGVRRERSAERGAAVLLHALPRLRERLETLEQNLTAEDEGSPGVSAAH